MNSNNTGIKRITHVVTLPGLTDATQMLGTYRNLFTTMGIPSTIPFEVQTEFTHPIPESQQILLNDYMQTYQLLRGALSAYRSVANTDSRVTLATITFVFECKE